MIFPSLPLFIHNIQKIKSTKKNRPPDALLSEPEFSEFSVFTE